MTKLSIWQRDKKSLAEKRVAYWEYIALLVDVVERESYLEEHDTLDSFLKNEAEMSRQRFHQLAKAVKTQINVSKIFDKKLEKESHLKEISKVPEKKQAEVAATTFERCELEGREPTAKDFRKTAKEIVEDAEWEYVEKDETEPLEEGEIDCGPVEAVDTEKELKRFLGIAKKHAEACARALGDADDCRKSPQYDPAVRRARDIQTMVDKW